MDIESFNRELAKKVGIANSLEKNNDIKTAIKAWILVTEMTLRASKEPRIDNTYRNMLIKKTEQIVSHIKQLKVKLALPKPSSNKIQPEEEFKVEEVLPSVPDHVPEAISEPESRDEVISPEKKEVVIDPKLKDIPEGFVEIKASEDFEILTPHEKLDIERFKDAGKVTVLDEDGGENTIDEKIIIEQPEEGGKLICFACGHENPPNSKYCKSCKTDLE